MKKDKNINSARIPVYRDAGFELHNADNTSGLFEKEKDNEHNPDEFIYSRYRNPTVVAAEEEIMKTEGSKWALLTQSGMSAVDIALSVFHKKDDKRPWLFFSEIYGGTNSYIDNILVAKRGINIKRFSADDDYYDLDYLAKTLEKYKPALVYFELISNPMLMIADATEIIKICHKYSASVIIDNTFATPLLYKPLEHGADLVIHSATKYLGGHGNITAGVICGNDINLMKSAIEYRKFTGHMISADEAYRLHTQMMTLELRFKRQCSNAESISAVLEDSELISKVYYPGLSSHKTHDIAARLFEGNIYGAMITFGFGGKTEEEKKARRDSFISSVYPVIRLVPSLGDTKTIILPVSSVWGDRYPDPGFIRMSVGTEEESVIKDVIEKALSSLT